MERMKFRVAALILALSLLMISGCSRREALEVGKPAPQFSLPDLDGKQISLEQYKGKVVLLDFWATWCGPCRMTMPVLEKLRKEYADSLVLLAINLQEPRDEVRNYMQQQGLKSHVLLDEKGSLGEVYGTEAIPMQVLIDKEGIVREVKTGFSPRLEQQLRQRIQQYK
jgi:thiol-disulfide isomerase/thioredoxin